MEEVKRMVLNNIQIDAITDMNKAIKADKEAYKNYNKAHKVWSITMERREKAMDIVYELFKKHL